MKQIFLLFLACYAYNCMSQCDNKMLNFDSTHPDYINFSINHFASNGDYTIETWLYSSATSNNPTCDNKVLLNLSDATSSITLSDCNGDLVLDIIGVGCTDNQILLNGIRSSWHHIAISRAGNNTVVTLNCSSEIYNSTTCSSYDITGDLIIGSNITALPSASWDGHIDELRLWSSVRSSTELCETLYCIVDPNETDLIAYYPMDQGVAGDTAFPANDNTAIISVDDLSSGSNHGTLNNFTMTGQSSNFICSTTPMIYPIEANLKITDYATQSTQVSQICSGDPLHFCILDNNNQVPTFDPDIIVSWEFNNGNGWQPFTSSSFGNNLCFGVGLNELILDCTYNTVGYEDWLIRAKFEISNSSLNVCEYYTSESSLRVCCDIEPISLSVVTNQAFDLFCDGDFADFNVNIISPYDFIQTPGPDVTVDWAYCENTTQTPLTFAQNNASFAYNNLPVSTGTICIKADITSCSTNKAVSLQKCFDVAAQPICGSITAIPDIGPLQTISNDPWVYQICPGDAAIIQLDNGFMNCTPNWEYSFDPTFATSFPLGIGNQAINTNSLPGNNWPAGTTSIYYRVTCQPTILPSGCDPCSSNIIEIRLAPPLTTPQISGPTQVCEGASTTWTVNNPINGITYSWICDGLPSASGNSISPDPNSCCVLVADDGCNTVQSNTQCLTECVITGSISCPKIPNQCPKVGDTINICICNAMSNCSTNLSYNWGWTSGTLVSQSGCDLFHIPSASGTTYTVTVTDVSNGCTKTFSLDIAPCI